MNPIETLISEGALNRIKEALQPGETYYCNEKIKASKGEVPSALVEEIQAFKMAGPEGTRIIAWFVRSTNGERINGEILLDLGEGSPSLIWKVDSPECGLVPELVYEQSKIISFSSNTDKMLKLSEPFEFLKALDREYGERMSKVMIDLNYVPRFEANDSMRASYKKIELERANV